MVLLAYSMPRNRRVKQNSLILLLLGTTQATGTAGGDETDLRAVRKSDG